MSLVLYCAPGMGSILSNVRQKFLDRGVARTRKMGYLRKNGRHPKFGNMASARYQRFRKPKISTHGWFPPRATGQIYTHFLTHFQAYFLTHFLTRFLTPFLHTVLIGLLEGYQAARHANSKK